MASGRLEFGDGEFGVREPGLVAHVVGREGADGVECGGTKRIAWDQMRVDDELEGWSGSVDDGGLVPVDDEVFGG